MASYLSGPSFAAPEFAAVQKRYVLEYLEMWRTRFKPDALELLSMALALEQIAGTLRQEAADMPHDQKNTPETPRSERSQGSENWN